MGTGYTRNDTSNNIANGNVIDADDLDGEFNGIEDAFDSSTGHTHDGTSAEGAPIEVTGPNQEYVSDATALYPKTDDTYDLGKTGSEWKDLYIDGTANIDTLAADSGTVGGSDITTTDNTQTLTNKTIDSASNTVTVDLTEATVTGTLAEFNTALSDDNFVSLTGSETLTNKTLTSPDINGGTIDGTVIGGSTPAAISGTTGQFDTSLNVDGTITSDGLTVQSGIADIRAGNIGPSTNPAVNIGRDDTSITGGNPLGYVQFLGSDNTAGSLTPHAYIGALASVTHTAGSNPTELVFGTTAGSSETIVDRMLISSGGDISFYEDTGTTPKFFWDASAESLGIGTTTPNSPVDINTSTSGTHLRLTYVGVRTWNAGVQSGGTFAIRDANAVADRLVINTSGNVGIGTSSPQSNLHVRNPSDAASILSIDHVSGGNGYGGYISSIGAGANQGLILGRKYNSTFTEAMRIDSSGNVGIGTTSPNRTLTVQDSIGTVAHFDSTGTSGGGISLGDANSTANANRIRGEGNELTFDTNSAEAMRIDSSGNVGIGTISPSATLDVNGSLSKSSGSFKIDHPIKPETHHLVHSFIEGPQADNIYRGKVALVGGTATVNLDEAGRMTEGTFVALNGNVQCFTTNEDGWTAVRGKVEGNILTIEAQDAACTDTVSWLVIGERHDQHMIDANWTDDQGRIITEPEKETAS